MKTRERRIEEGTLAVRMGHGANCSSIGSVVDTLFASATIGAAVIAAIAAAMAKEKVTAVKGETPSPDMPPPDAEEKRR